MLNIAIKDWHLEQQHKCIQQYQWHNMHDISSVPFFLSSIAICMLFSDKNVLLNYYAGVLTFGRESVYFAYTFNGILINTKSTQKWNMQKMIFCRWQLIKKENT